MYKILVVASTEHILKTKQEFEKCGLAFDFLIAQKKSTYDFGCFDHQSINIDHELIPFSENKDLIALTKSQENKKKMFEKQIRQLKHILFQNLKSIKKTENIKKVTTRLEQNSDVIYLEDVVDLKLSPQLKEQKFHLEILRSGVRNYDHVLFEESHLNMTFFVDKFQQQNFFKFQRQETFQFYGLKFKISEIIGDFKFWLMADTGYNSIYDNLYYISTTDDIMDVWLWLPAQHLKNPMTLEYFSKRTQMQVQKKFAFLKLEPISESLPLQPINTYFVAQSRHANNITFIPHFHFYSNQQVVDTVNGLTDAVVKKLKIKKEFIQNNQIEGAL